MKIWKRWLEHDNNNQENDYYKPSIENNEKHEKQFCNHDNTSKQ